ILQPSFSSISTSSIPSYFSENIEIHKVEKKDSQVQVNMHVDKSIENINMTNQFYDSKRNVIYPETFYLAEKKLNRVKEENAMLKRYASVARQSIISSDFSNENTDLRIINKKLVLDHQKLMKKFNEQKNVIKVLTEINNDKSENMNSIEYKIKPVYPRIIVKGNSINDSGCYDEGKSFHSNKWHHQYLIAKSKVENLKKIVVAEKIN
ncbi:MAG: hypothetical protein MHPSP_000699, partial [Paramarteilia canceri]